MKIYLSILGHHAVASPYSHTIPGHFVQKPNLIFEHFEECLKLAADLAIL